MLAQALQLLLVATELATGSPAPEDPHRHPAHFEDVSAITFDQALRLSLTTEALGRTRETLDARRRATDEIPRLTQNPQLTVQPGARLDPEDERGFAIQAQLTQSWNLRDPGRARRNAMEAETAALSAEVRRRALAARLDAARAWIDLDAAQATLDLAREELELAQRWLERARVAYEARVILRPDLAEVKRYVASVDARVVELEGRVHDLGLALALAAGLSPRAPVRAKGPPPRPELPPSSELGARLDRVEELPAVTAARLEAIAARARAVEARAERGTQLTAGAAVMRDGPTELIVQGVVGISIPVFDRGQAESARSQTDAGLSLAEAANAERQLQFEVAQVLHEVEHTRLVYHRLKTELLPTLTALVEATEAGRTAGETTVFEALTARRDLMIARAELIDAGSRLAWAEVIAWLYLAELERPEGEAP